MQSRPKPTCCFKISPIFLLIIAALAITAKTSVKGSPGPGCLPSALYNHLQFVRCQTISQCCFRFSPLFFSFLFSSTTLLLPTYLPPPSGTHAQSCNPMDCERSGMLRHAPEKCHRQSSRGWLNFWRLTPCTLVQSGTDTEPLDTNHRISPRFLPYMGRPGLDSGPG